MPNKFHWTPVVITADWNSGQTTTFNSSPTAASYPQPTGTVSHIKDRWINAVAFEYTDDEKTASISTVREQNRQHGDFDLRGGSLKYGHWEIRDLALCDSDTDYCGNVKFVPNVAAINTIVGSTVKIELELKTEHVNPQGNLRVPGRPEVLTITIMGQSKVSLEWDETVSGDIEWDSQMNYSNLTGILTRYDSTTTFQTMIETKETNGATMTNGMAGSASSSIGFAATEYGTNFAFGTWYVATDFSKFVFKPNPSGINGLDPGEEVTSRLTVKISPAGSSTELASDFIEVTIKRTITIETAWDSNKTVEEIESDGTSPTYVDIMGSYTIGNQPANSDIEVSVIERLSTATMGGTSVSGLTAVTDPTGGYKIVGTANSLTYGHWYINDTTKVIIYRPNPTGVNGVTFGNTYTSTLTISYFKTDANNQNRTKVDEATISINISRQTGFNLVFETNQQSEYVITSDGTSDYPTITASGIIVNPPMGYNTLVRHVREQKNQEAEFSYRFNSIAFRDNIGWQTDTHDMGHGTWEYGFDIPNDTHHMNFMPKDDVINALEENDVVVSKLTVIVCSAACEEESAIVESRIIVTRTITIRIVGPGDEKVELAWNTGFDGTVTKQGTQANYVDRPGTVSSIRLNQQHRFGVQITESKAGTSDKHGNNRNRKLESWFCRKTL